MDTHYFVLAFLLFPFISFLAVLCTPEGKERLISQNSIYAIGITLFLLLSFLLNWAARGMPVYNIKELVLYANKHYVFLIDFYFDEVSAIYLFVGAFIAFLVIRYSSYYMHLEKGYKRFFANILFFYFSYNFTVLAGNFETLFLGWEFLGVSSFLLIAFYRDRYLPVRNAVKVFSVYRIGDIGILLAMWASHHLWHENITFAKLLNYDLVHHYIEEHSSVGLFIAICLLVAAAAKSAQFPFSSWIPRAMEGPTPSSAIFYGSLSIHFGVFLLLRTMPFWEQQTFARILVALVGVLTAVSGYSIASVQPTIKTQIAYASVAQIGLMFVEIALGWKWLALFHFAGNAFLRTYQLLVSPSVVAYLIRDQFYHFKPYSHAKQKYWLGKKLYYGWYMLSLKEFFLDDFFRVVIFRPFKWIGSRLRFITYRNVLLIFIPSYGLGWGLYFWASYFPVWLHSFTSAVFGAIALLMVTRAFSERLDPLLAWLNLILGHFWIGLSVIYNEDFGFAELVWYWSGVVLAGVAGWGCLVWLKNKETNLFSLHRYFGHSYEYPRVAGMFLLACLGLMGFPITTTFIGEDLIFSHVHQEQFLLAFLLSSCFVIQGITLIRLYARLFLGSHAKVYHSTPLQSS